MLARIATLSGERATLVARVDEIARAIEVETALLRYFPGGDADGTPRTRTIRAMLKEVLAEAGSPIGIRQMIDAMQARFGATVARTSISPILRKMLGRGEVEHVGDKWQLGQAGHPEAS
ncbi:hypothetical protein SPAN111604_01345 [Sphingomonas antarctica]|uniref:hypothetical protein n=1 Tax=Sphingomonas antarctica TaxID=2040274 RepID=UPI0039EAAF40